MKKLIFKIVVSLIVQFDVIERKIINGKNATSQTQQKQQKEKRKEKKLIFCVQKMQM